MKSLTRRLNEHYTELNEAKITSEKQFREWAETVLKKAHGDNYDQSIADKTIKDLSGDVKDGDWGEAVGRLSSGLE